MAARGGSSCDRQVQSAWRAHAPVAHAYARAVARAAARSAPQRNSCGTWETELLAYYGMEVVKIETGTIASKEREAAVHACMNRAKLGCTVNLRNADGKELFKQLVGKSDVVVDNFSSGVLERLGFSYDVLQQINPRIVQAVMPGWGLTGPLQSWVAWGWQLLAYTGIMRLWGYPDSPMETRCKIAC